MYATIASAVIAAIGVGVSYSNGQQQASAARSAQAQAKANADQQAALAEQDMNRANQKKPNTTSILSAAMQSGKSGVSGTMLTGSQGVSTDQLSLGRSTLLGQ